MRKTKTNRLSDTATISELDVVATLKNYVAENPESESVAEEFAADLLGHSVDWLWGRM